MEIIGDYRIEGMGYVDENRNIIFICFRILLGLMNKLFFLEIQELVVCEKLFIFIF